MERTHSWLNRFRRLLVRSEKREDTYLGMLHLALAIITWFRLVSEERVLHFALSEALRTRVPVGSMVQVEFLPSEDRAAAAPQ